MANFDNFKSADSSYIVDAKDGPGNEAVEKAFADLLPLLEAAKAEPGGATVWISGGPEANSPTPEEAETAWWQYDQLRRPGELYANLLPSKVKALEAELLAMYGARPY